MDRVPSLVFDFLGCTRGDAHDMGMVGCGLQLTDLGDFSWRETTCTLSLEKDEVKVFLTIEGIPFEGVPNFGNYVRVRLLHMGEYVKYFTSIQEFLGLYRRKRFLRLGRRARLPPWELDSHDAFILRMEESAFRTHYVCDPRGHIPHSRISSNETLHDPIMLVQPDGLPDPGAGGWIRANSIAVTTEGLLT